MTVCDRCLHNAALHQGTSGCLSRGCLCVRTNGAAHADAVRSFVSRIADMIAPFGPTDLSRLDVMDGVGQRTGPE